MILGVWHFSFTVSDMERSVAFYRDVLGFELIHRQSSSSEYIRRLVGYPDAELRVAMFAVPGQPRGISSHDLELVEYLVPRGARGDAEIRNPGEAHLAVTVTDIAETYARLVALGVRFFSPPNPITAGVNEGGFACYFHDPDRIVIELLQPPAKRLAAARQ
jgi:catechol 2,3-dioxygenase-like lactoylglutathione lyase family enzyme